MTLTIGMDGNMWFCHNGKNFIDLQSSICGWGETEEEAVLSYLGQYYS